MHNVRDAVACKAALHDELRAEEAITGADVQTAKSSRKQRSGVYVCDCSHTDVFHIRAHVREESRSINEELVVAAEELADEEGLMVRVVDKAAMVLHRCDSEMTPRFDWLVDW
ncbi:hypothetical protein NXY56_005562 [Leishmania guyanensis]|uniref:Uncharacterized protein n=1 Tax=Leishmania guyanensis TaxID=5670 RepID=A0A1E1J397_LEIGU|nr:hypothetical protein, unknown function [Leishmania guyanensis]